MDKQIEVATVTYIRTYVCVFVICKKKINYEKYDCKSRKVTCETTSYLHFIYILYLNPSVYSGFLKATFCRGPALYFRT
jgi:hypothetical protein